MVTMVGFDLWCRRVGWTRRVLEGNVFHSRGPQGRTAKSGRSERADPKGPHLSPAVRGWGKEPQLCQADQEQGQLQSPTHSQQPLRTRSGAAEPTRASTRLSQVPGSPTSPVFLSKGRQ